jgi:hypothetical protein
MIDSNIVRFGFRQIFRTRKFLFAALVSLLPLIAGIILFAVDATQVSERTYAFNGDVTETIAFFMIAGTIPFVALLMAGGLLADEAEDRTLTYLLVRPVPRSKLYVSKALPVVATTMVLAMLQVLSFGLMRFIAWLAFGSGDTEFLVQTTPGVLPGTIDAGWLVVRSTLLAVPVAALVAGVLAGFFGFVSLITTKYHFFANLLAYLTWELQLGYAGAGLSHLTVTYHAVSALDRFDPTMRNSLVGPTSHPAFGLIWLAVWIGIWLYAGAQLVGRRGFNVTSAAS